MGELVEFKQREKQLAAHRVVPCHKCGEHLMRMLGNGDIHCAGCHAPQAAHWLPDPGSMV